MLEKIGRHYSEERKKAKRKPQKQRDESDEKKTKKRKVHQPLPSQDAVHLQAVPQPMNDEVEAEEQKVQGLVIETRKNEIYEDNGCLNIIIEKREAERLRENITKTIEAKRQASAEILVVESVFRLMVAKRKAAEKKQIIENERQLSEEMRAVENSLMVLIGERFEKSLSM